MELEIRISRRILKKAIGVFVAVALFFGVCSPAVSFMPDVAFGASAAGVVVTSGNCGVDAYYKLYDDGALIISGSGTVGYYDFFGNDYYQFDAFTKSNSKNLIIESGITKVHANTFKGWINLETVEMADSVIEFSEDYDFNAAHFEGCISLESVKLSKSLKDLPWKCFKDCTSLEFIEIPSCVASIGSNSFEGCTSLETVRFNEGIENIGNAAFSRCYSLKEVNLPSTVKTVGDGAFNDCIYLEEVTIPESVTSIGSGLFTNCIRLSKVNIMNPDCKILYDRDTIPETAVIYGYSGSTAEKYATDWMRKFVPLDREHDHEFESRVTLKPTCSATGTEEYTCYCGESYTEVVPVNSHFDVNKDDNCDMCGVKLNAFDQPVKPDEDEDGGTTEAPEGDSGSAQEPEEEKNVFEKFFESLVGFFKKFANIFDFFKDLF